MGKDPEPPIAGMGCRVHGLNCLHLLIPHEQLPSHEGAHADDLVGRVARDLDDRLTKGIIEMLPTPKPGRSPRRRRLSQYHLKQLKNRAFVIRTIGSHEDPISTWTG